MRNTVLWNETYCIGSSSATTTLTASPRDLAALIWLFLTGLCCGLGCLANSLVLVVILKYQILRQGVGLVIAHLLVCHFIMASVNYPLIMSRVLATMSNVELSCELCHQQHPLFVAFNKMVNWSKGLIALNRLVAILAPITFRSWNKSYIQCAALIICWCSVLLFVVPPIFDVWDTYRMTFIGTCVLDTLPDTSHVYYLLFTFNAYSPIILITTATIIIVGKFARDFPRLRVPLHNSASPKSQSVMSNRQKRISRMLLISFVLSLTCQLSTYTAMICGVMVKQPVMALYFFWLSLVQYCASPVSSKSNCHCVIGLQNFSSNCFEFLLKMTELKAIRSN